MASSETKKVKKSKREVDSSKAAASVPLEGKKSKVKSKSKSKDAEIAEKLKHKALQTPQKPAPPPELLHMVSSFLASYGFEGTNRLFTTEWAARASLTGWESPKEADGASDAVPELIGLYNASNPPTNIAQADKKQAVQDDTSSSGSDVSSDDETSSSSASDSDSESSEDDTPIPPPVAPAKLPGASSTSTLKRKASSSSTISSKSSTSSSTASSGSSSSDSERPVKKPKIEATEIKVAVPVKKIAKADSSSSESSLSDSSSDEEAAVFATPVVAFAPNAEKLSHANGKAGRSSSSSSASETRPFYDATGSPTDTPTVAVAVTTVKKIDGTLPDESTEKGGRGIKKTSAPFRRIPEDTKVDTRFSSNAYQSYDYADRAYRDLSVTKGKGFTKEKNKKKRGSYRGGAIDIWGAKGVKFDD